ncbi:MAG: hypothetical protein KJ955_08440 [Nanoarchaeota archaeon]|nr:hypothetical protein [Nanoarchaeota archaeon]
MEITTIELPQDRALRGCLERKLGEYRQRMQEATASADFQSPEQAGKRKIKYMDSLYKSLLLETLLTDGRVDVEAAREQLGKVEGKVDEYYFTTAVTVIADYCATGGSNCWGGTGI